MQSLFQRKESSSGNERFSKCYLSFLQRNIRVMMEWSWWAKKGPAMGCRWDALAVALPEAHAGATSNVGTCRFLCFLHPVLLDEGFMCKICCFRAGWNWWWKHCCFLHQQPTCSTGWTAVSWNVKFVKFITLKSRACDQSKDYSKYIVSLSNLVHELNLASLFDLATIFITMSFLLIFSNATVLRFTIHLLTLSE